jgi:virginiamycin B lyase
MRLRTLAIVVPALCAATLLPPATTAQEPFVRGEANQDGRLDVSDAVRVLIHLFAGGGPLACADAGDANDDGQIDIADPVRVLAFLFASAAPLPAPFPDCGADPSDDAVDCAVSSCVVEEPDPEIREWTVPYARSRPRDPYVDDQGRVWFVGQTADYAAYLRPETGEFTRFDLADGAGPHNIIVDAYAWYSGNTASHIGRVDRETGSITRYPMPDAAARDPHTLVFDQKGAIWFTVQSGNFVGRLIKESGEVALRRPPTSNARPYGIALDSTGRPWFVEFGVNKIGSIDAETLAIREFTIPQSGARPRRIGITSDDVIWYVDYARGYLGRFDPAAERFTERLLPGGAGSRPYGMAVDHRDRIWCAETGRSPNRLVSFDPERGEFVDNLAVPSGGGVIRHMYFHPPSREVWFGTDVNTIGRVRLP